MDLAGAGFLKAASFVLAGFGFAALPLRNTSDVKMLMVAVCL
jgi:hypothetical protein